MATDHLQHFWGLSLALTLFFIHSASISQVYIVYLGHNQFDDPILTSNSHLQLLSNVFASQEDVMQSIIYSYKHSFSGFSAKLNSTQAAALAKMDKVISVFRSKTMKLHTTRSWDFLGLTLDDSQGSNPLQKAYGEDVIVGMFDSGVWPESESFQEEPGIGPIPSCWSGQCEKGEHFDPAKDCNLKLIGARYYLNGYEQEFGALNTSSPSEYRSARDHVGHGTHTASTAVGSIVKNVSFLGFAQGVARGGAPRARLAVYKVCWRTKDTTADGRCTEADILAAFDDALSDGVHVISASFGSLPPLTDFFDSTAAVGSFHAMQLGISVVFSAGNAGPTPGLVENVSPWAISVAVSTIDRTFPTQILINSNFSVMGEGLVTTEIKGKIAYADNFFSDGVCVEENWTGRLAAGRAILCFSIVGSITSGLAELAVKKAKGSALIFAEPMTRQFADVDIIPTIRVDLSQGTKIKNYLFQFSKFPPVEISPSKTIIGKSPAPSVAYFSSRGPSSISPDILKPDVTAPGINILAAWPPNIPPPLSIETRRVNWTFLSGTSMSCPHVSGVAALLKSAHPKWSPAAIRSALMTTAYNKDTTFDSILSGGTMKVSDPFDVGAGHINPLKAIDPGLVYDMKSSDYILFLCNIGYNQTQIKRMVLPCAGLDIRCKRTRKSNANINYPSITVANLQSTMTIKRTVRNVGQNKNAIYFARIVKPQGVEVVIWPRILLFSCFKEEMSYYVTLKPLKKSQGRYDFGEIVWSDGFHNVRSPLVVYVNTTCDDSRDHFTTITTHKSI